MRPWWARPWGPPVATTMIRVYRAYRLEDGTVRYETQRDPALGPVSPRDYPWRRGRDPEVGDVLLDLPDHERRRVVVVERHWIGDHLDVIAQSWSLDDPVPGRL